MKKNMGTVATLVELNDDELKAVAGGFFNNSFNNFLNGGTANGGTANGMNTVANGGNANGGGIGKISFNIPVYFWLNLYLSNGNGTTA